MTTPSMLQWLSAPVLYTTPSSTRYYDSSSAVFVNGSEYILTPYSDPYLGNTTVEPKSFAFYNVDFFGNLVPISQSVVSGINALGLQDVNSFSLTDQITAFKGSTTGADFAEYVDTLNSNGTATFYTFVVNTSGASPVVDNGPQITITPVPSSLVSKIEAHLTSIGGSNTINDVLFEVAGAPTPGTTTGTFDIINASGGLVVSGTGFTFSDNKAHVFDVGDWNSTQYAQLVEVWNAATNLADVQLTVITGATGVLQHGWTAATEMESITRISHDFISGAGAGLVLLVDGTDHTGQAGFVMDIVDDTSVSGGTGGTIDASATTYYSGTVGQDARMIDSGQGNNEYVVYWIDSNGLTVDLVNSSLNVLETYNIAQATKADISALGDGRLFVSYEVATASNAVDDYTILDTRLTGQTFSASSGVNNIAGTPENDTFNLTGGTNTVYGGGGHDTALFPLASTNYSITANVSGGVTVSGPNQTDQLQNVEFLQFTDQTIFVENSSNASIALLYSAALDRLPDTAGLSGWEDFYTNQVSAAAKAQGVYVALAETPLQVNGLSIADGFIQSPEFQHTYGSLNNTQFVTQLYANVLDRAPDAAGLAGWLSLMQNQGYTQGMVLVGFAESAENIANAHWLITL